MPPVNPSSELEEFLRKTAEIRQRKTITQRVEANERRQSQSPTRPQYTNARRERLTESSRFQYEEIDAAMIDEDEEILPGEILAAEVIEEAPARLRSRDVQTPEHVHKEHGGPDRPTSAGNDPNDPIESLKAMLHRPNGLR